MFQKFTLYEESIRVPFIVSCLGDGVPVQKNRFDREHFISGVDLVPTVYDYAGIDAAEAVQVERSKRCPKPPRHERASAGRRRRECRGANSHMLRATTGDVRWSRTGINMSRNISLLTRRIFVHRDRTHHVLVVHSFSIYRNGSVGNTESGESAGVRRCN